MATGRNEPYAYEGGGRREGKREREREREREKKDTQIPFMVARDEC